MNTTAYGRSDRFESEAVTKLEAIERIGACSDGRVYLLDFGVIQERLGARWELKKYDVYALIIRFIERVGGRATMHSVADDCRFIVCFSKVDRHDAVGLSYRIMEEVLTHLFGAPEPDHVRVAHVTSLAGGRVASQQLSSPEALRGNSRTTAPLKPKPKITAEPVLVDVASGRVPLRYSLESIVAVRVSSAIGYRLSVTLYDAHSVYTLPLRDRAALPTASLLAIDLKTLKEARMSGLTAGDYRLTMIPLSIQSFSSSRSRTAVFDVLNRLSPEERARLIIELVGVEEGFPASGLTEVAALLKPFCRSSAFQTPVGRTSIIQLRSARPAAVTVQASDLGTHSRQVASGLLLFGEIAKGVAPNLFATGLPDEAMLSVCEVAGISHATLIS